MAFRADDNICALATPVGRSAIAVVRLSGPQAWELAKKVAPGLNSKMEIVSHQALRVSLFDPQTQKAFDDALLLFFAAGRSYTGETSVEFFTHGSMAITQHLLELLVSFGARIAEPGEFTFRAYMNDRMDLMQAEGVLSLIHSESIEQAQQSLRHLRGEFSKTVLDLEDKILWLLGQLEAGIDFATEGIELISYALVHEHLTVLEQSVQALVQQAQRGQLLQQGLSLAIVGAPNAGKSSLLNNLVREAKALVSPQAGTTRDAIESFVMLDGVKVKFIDTAGLRETDDEVERLGIQKTWQIIEDAHLLIHVIDGASNLGEDDLHLHHSKGQKVVVFTRADVVTLEQRQQMEARVSHLGVPFLWVSNWESEQTRTVIFHYLRERFFMGQLVDQSLLIHARQLEWLLSTLGSIRNAVVLCRDNSGHEFISLELRTALDGVQRILGHHYDDQILDRIFSDFCIGK